jgi:hypothetical protein
MPELRERLIDLGLLRPLPAEPIAPTTSGPCLRLDDVGRAAAERTIADYRRTGEILALRDLDNVLPRARR